MEIYNYNTDT